MAAQLLHCVKVSAYSTTLPLYCWTGFDEDWEMGDISLHLLELVIGMTTQQ